MLARVGGNSLEFSCVPAVGGTGILRMICRLNWDGIDRFLAEGHRMNFNVGGTGDRE